MTQTAVTNATSCSSCGVATMTDGRTTVASYEYAVQFTIDSLTGWAKKSHPYGGRERRMYEQVDNGEVSGEVNGVATE